MPICTYLYETIVTPETTEPGSEESDETIFNTDSGATERSGSSDFLSEKLEALLTTENAEKLSIEENVSPVLPRLDN